jgi:hypothetical protein
VRVSVYVVLSRSTTVPSRVIRMVTGDEYTHASLALDPGLELMFSFGRRRVLNPFAGCFKRERFDDALYQGMDVLPGLVLEVPVTTAQRDAVRARVAEILLDGHTYRYNFPGALARGRVGREDDRRYFCSEFVYDVLRGAGVCDLGVPRATVRPQTLLQLPGTVVYRGNLKEYRPPAGAPVTAVPALTWDRTHVRIAA